MITVRTKTLVTYAIFACALVAFSAMNASAQNPFSIDGIVQTTNVGTTNNSGRCRDGSLPVNGVCPVLAAPTPQALSTPDPSSNSKEIGPANGSTQQLGVINLAQPPMLANTSIDPKNDLTSVLTQSTTVATDLWFYFAWTRQTATGSGFISIEFNHKAAPSACVYTKTLAQLNSDGCNPWANRQGDGTPGPNTDFIISWDQTGNSVTPSSIGVRYFNAATNSFTAPVTVLPANAQAAYRSDLLAGELAINLSAIEGEPTACLTFANIIPFSITGNSDSADYKDVVLSAFPVASNCGSLSVRKITLDPNGNEITDATNSAGTYRYKLDRTSASNIRFNVVTPPAPDDPCSVPACEETLQDSIRTLTHDGDRRDHADLIAAADYRLGEDLTVLESKWSFYGITCAVGTAFPAPGTSSDPLTAISVQVGKITYCTITNKFVKTTPTGTSEEFVRLYDKVYLTNLNPFASDRTSATVTFGLFTDINCSAASRVPQTSDIVKGITYDDSPTGGGKSGTAEISIQTLGPGVGTSATYYWKWQYSGDALNNPLSDATTPSTAKCDESTLITFGGAGLKAPQ